jgi:hypothetical protein
MLSMLCLCILALLRIPDMILGDKSLISDVVLSQLAETCKSARVCCVIYQARLTFSFLLRL